MVSFWQSKKDDGDAQGPSQNQEEGSQANERSRLLPSQPREGYLSPDDPAVSPPFFSSWKLNFEA